MFADNWPNRALSGVAGTLQDVVGLDEASGFVSVVGQKIGDEINSAYTSALAVGKRPVAESVGGRIGRLSRDGVIPRQIAAMMRTVTEMRNATEYESKVLSAAESGAVSAAYAAIREWAVAKELPFAGST